MTSGAVLVHSPDTSQRHTSTNPPGRGRDQPDSPSVPFRRAVWVVQGVRAGLQKVCIFCLWAEHVGTTQLTLRVLMLQGLDIHPNTDGLTFVYTSTGEER